MPVVSAAADAELACQYARRAADAAITGREHAESVLLTEAMALYPGDAVPHAIAPLQEEVRVTREAEREALVRLLRAQDALAQVGA